MRFFIMDCGWKLYQLGPDDDHAWTDGDLTFDNGPDNLPVDVNGERLDGVLHEYPE